jgi:hypothetical protein
VDKFLEDISNEYGTAKKEMSNDAIAKFRNFLGQEIFGNYVMWLKGW